jgi:hypothetical protein
VNSQPGSKGITVDGVSGAYIELFSERKNKDKNLVALPLLSIKNINFIHVAYFLAVNSTRQSRFLKKSPL